MNSSGITCSVIHHSSAAPHSFQRGFIGHGHTHPHEPIGTRMTPVTSYWLCPVTQSTGNLGLGWTQPSHGARNRKPVGELFFLQQPQDERVTLG